MKHVKKYLLNGFLFLIPVLLWNILLADKLPREYQKEIFWNNIPKWLAFGENSLRLLIFILPVVIRVSIKSKLQITGFILYLSGIIVYFSSWLFMIFYPDSSFASSAAGFMAPAYTTLIWLCGIGLMVQQTLIKIPRITLLYILLSILFVAVHTYHTYVVFQSL